MRVANHSSEKAGTVGWTRRKKLKRNHRGPIEVTKWKSCPCKPQEGFRWERRYGCTHFNLDTRWKRAVSLTFRPLWCGENPRTDWIRHWVVLRDFLGFSKKRAFVGIQTRNSLASNPVTVSNTLFPARMEVIFFRSKKSSFKISVAFSKIRKQHLPYAHPLFPLYSVSGSNGRNVASA